MSISCRSTAERPHTIHPKNPIASATSTPRFAADQVPVFPPSPNGPSRYPCHDSHDAYELTTNPNPIPDPITISETGIQRTAPYRPPGAYRSASAYGDRRRKTSASITPHHAAIGTPSVIRNPSNGPMNDEEKNTT
ncbi:MAG TPA: hypothetical protein VF060_30645 [Trebonia sp.]